VLGAVVVDSDETTSSVGDTMDSVDA